MCAAEIREGKKVTLKNSPFCMDLPGGRVYFGILSKGFMIYGDKPGHLTVTVEGLRLSVPNFEGSKFESWMKECGMRVVEKNRLCIGENICVLPVCRTVVEESEKSYACD